MTKGGKRPKSGRPPGSTKKAYLKRICLNSFRLPRWMVDKIHALPGSGGKIIEKALLEKYHWKEPDDR